MKSLAVALCVLLCATVVAAKDKDGTFNSLVENVLSYAVIIIPAALVVRYFKQYPEKIEGYGALAPLLKSFVIGDPADAETGSAEGAAGGKKQPKDAEDNPDANKPAWMKTLTICFYIAGLQGTYLTWGVLQEQMMTQDYGVDEDGNPVRFKNSQYLVFLNRGLALIISYVWILVTVQPRHRAPLFKYSFPSMANVMSSWCQYEALKYVSFPTQVLAKSTKIIPVMIMGKFVQGKTYPIYEYVCAILLSIGVALFLFSRADEEEAISQEEDVPSGLVLVFGAFLLVGYMVFDSFTSNYQSAMFKQYKVSSYQMMNGVNIFSCIFTLWTLIQRGTLMGCVEFTFKYPTFMWHSFWLSICSAVGQLFIFKTIEKYGALVFAIIMTTRQVLSIFVSAMVFGHQFSWGGNVGVIICFISIFGRMYCEKSFGSSGPKGGNK